MTTDGISDYDRGIEMGRIRLTLENHSETLSRISVSIENQAVINNTLSNLMTEMRADAKAEKDKVISVRGALSNARENMWSPVQRFSVIALAISNVVTVWALVRR